MLQIRTAKLRIFPDDDRAAAMNLQRMGMEYVLRAQVS